MPSAPQLLNLELAWLRVKSDARNRVFVSPPFDIDMVHVDAQAWLATLREQLIAGTYHPSPMRVCDVPKGAGAIRPGACLTLPDQVVYAAAVGACLPAIHGRVATNQGKIEYSHPLNNRLNAIMWVKSAFSSWSAFRKASLAHLARGVPYIVTADISSYYDNVDIATLISDLRACNCPAQAIALLSTCLNRWAMVTGRGMPQGFTASDVLQKVYLESVDTTIRTSGYRHVRYVDDIRIFCRSRAESQRAIKDLARLLRNRGLQLQTAKTRVLPSADARRLIEGIAPVVAAVQQQFIASAQAALGMGSDYLSVTDVDRLLVSNPEDAPLETVREAYKAYFIDSDARSFDKTLFHFLLNRLGKHSDPFALADCLGLLSAHPEETVPILMYAERVDGMSQADTALVAFLRSPDAVYDYQAFAIWAWLWGTTHVPSDELLQIVREHALGGTVEWYVVSMARALLGRFGTTADLEALQALYAQVADPIEQARVLCALARMEPGRRNGFLARAEGDGDWQRRAVRIAKR